jgi:DNA-binding transcriptional MerR regulator
VGSNVTIGRFSCATHLSVKTLRHYHEVGLLAPSEIDPHTGYRYYTEEQIATAQVIRRLRALQMPVGDVRAVLSAPDAEARNRVIAAHLGRLERELARTSGAVAELGRLLERGTEQERVEQVAIPAPELSRSCAIKARPRTSISPTASSGRTSCVTRSASTDRRVSTTSLDYSTRARLTNGRLRSDGRSFALTLGADRSRVSARCR